MWPALLVTHGATGRDTREPDRIIDNVSFLHFVKLGSAGIFASAKLEGPIKIQDPRRRAPTSHLILQRYLPS